MSNNPSDKRKKTSNKRRITMIVPIDSTVDKWVKAQNTQTQSINLALTLIASKYGNRDLLEAMSEEVLGIAAPKPEEARSQTPPAPKKEEEPEDDDDDDIGFLGY